MIIRKRAIFYSGEYQRTLNPVLKWKISKLPPTCGDCISVHCSEIVAINQTFRTKAEKH
ncbi:hypothetical protein WH47_05559 [Habropoda laboriosa]|uniref:Uncharacterized protein n=1 Tax=Habropoda laboriosa TaxID=597456 RepID=A0A0L7RFV6_9HYME|nr:hypothetical protein WH47_05559 [Habropoda laboriosa]